MWLNLLVVGMYSGSTKSKIAHLVQIRFSPVVFYLNRQINTEVVNVQKLVGQVVRQSKGESREGESDRTDRGTLIIFRHNPTGANRLGKTLQKLTSLPGGFLFATIFLTCLH